MKSKRTNKRIKLMSVVTLLLPAAVGLLFGSEAFAYDLNQSAADRYGSNLNCTANDVSITGIAIVPGGPTSCVGGETLTLDLDVTLNFAQPSRYDIGIFLASDGKDPAVTSANGGSASCKVSVLPLGTPFLNLDFDGCGDGNGSIGNNTGSGVLRITDVPVLCQAVDLSGGKLYIPYLTSWDNTSGAVCNSAADPAPNTSSKCNVPKSTVEADVLRSTVELVALPTISKTDGVTTLTAGDSTIYSVVITNTTGSTLRNAIFQDPAIANLTVNSLSCSATGGATCPATTAISTMQGGGITLPAMPANSSVTFTIGATVNPAAPAGPLANTALVVVNGESNSATDTNNLLTKFIVGKSFAPSSISVNGESTLSISLQNSNLSAATGVAFTDIYPAPLVNAAVPAVTNTCGGTVTADPNGGSLALSGGTIPAGGSCTITAKVTSGTAGAYTNTTSPVTSAEGFVGEPASASLAVGVSNLSTTTKAWQDLNGGEPDPGDLIRYTITLRETAGVNATGVSLSDNVHGTLTGLTVVACPSGATCSFVGQTLTATGVTVPANGSVAISFNATIPTGTPAGTVVNNCADIDNPGGIGVSPCASALIVSPSAIAGSGNKRLYLYGGAASPRTLSRSMPGTVQGPVTISQGTNQVWRLSPALASPVTISPDVTPLAIIPVNLYLASNAANSTRRVQVDVNCSGGGTTYSETKIFDGTAVNNPYLPTTPTLVSFSNLTISANQFCGAGQTWNLTVRNTGSGSVIVHPASGGNNSYISLPSLNIINVDSVMPYSAAHPSTTAPLGGFFGGGQTVYLRAVVSDPFGSFDITSATITIKDPGGTTVVANAAMGQVADSGSITKTFEYPYTIPTSTGSGSWTALVTAHEGTERTISDDGAGAFGVGLPDITLVKMVQTYSDPVHGTSTPYSIPGAVMRYTILATNTGRGTADVDSVRVTDLIPNQTDLVVSGSPVLFVEGAVPSGLTFNVDTDVTFYDAADNPITPSADGNGIDPAVRKIVINPKGVFLASNGTNHPRFSLIFHARVR